MREINSAGICSYSCIYCQVGATHQQEISPRPCYAPEVIQRAVQSRLEAAQRGAEKIDYLTFADNTAEGTR